jgi:hypothetical protein
MLDLSPWPAGMRVIVRKERPHPRAQLRFTDLDGHRFTAFATDAKKGQLADLELRHRRRARCEDRIRCAKDTGLRNLPLKGFAQNQVWCEIVALACELLAWTQMLAMTGTARRWEPRSYGCACSRPPGAWPAAAAACAPPRPAMALGRPDHRPAIRLTSRNDPDDTEGATRAGGTPPTWRDSRAAGHRPHQKINPSRAQQAGRSWALIRLRLAGFRNSATPDLGSYAVRSYSLRRPPRTDQRWIRSVERSATCRVPELGHSPDLAFYAARSYSLIRPPRTGRRLIRSLEGSATG